MPEAQGATSPDERGPVNIEALAERLKDAVAGGDMVEAQVAMLEMAVAAGITLQELDSVREGEEAQPLIEARHLISQLKLPEVQASGERLIAVFDGLAKLGPVAGAAEFYLRQVAGQEGLRLPVRAAAARAFSAVHPDTDERIINLLKILPPVESLDEVRETRELDLAVAHGIGDSQGQGRLYHAEMLCGVLLVYATAGDSEMVESFFRALGRCVPQFELRKDAAIAFAKLAIDTDNAYTEKTRGRAANLLIHSADRPYNQLCEVGAYVKNLLSEENLRSLIERENAPAIIGRAHILGLRVEEAIRRAR